VSLNSSTLAAEYLEIGLVLVPIPKGSKAPKGKGWNRLANCVSASNAKPITGNIGLAHLYSKTCVIDVDDFMQAEEWLADQGVDLTALLLAENAVQISSGRPNRVKLLYRLPASIDSLLTHQIGGHIEFRCASKTGTTVQDVLPPSIHPDTGKPYAWKGDWRHIPELPATVLEVWQSLEEPTKESTKSATELGEAIQEGSRNLTLFKRASSLRAKGKGTRAITTALLEMNCMRCTPPLPADEVQRIANSVGKYPPGEAHIKYIWRDWVKSEAGPPSPTTRHVLVTLSDYMNKDGGSCFPTIKRLAKETNRSEKTVKTHLALAVSKGWIFRYTHMGEGQAWRNYGYIANPKVVFGLDEGGVPVTPRLGEK
jgi:hypothetical protein